MKNKEEKMSPGCRMCGECCNMEIPLTLLDIKRIAGFIGEDEKGVFEDIVQSRISQSSSLFMIKKNQDEGCIFLKDRKECSIHPAKPNACKFYSCTLHSGSDFMPWTATCTDPSQRARLWEQSVAALVTKAYIKENGSQWNQSDFDKAIKSINENIVTHENQNIKLARERYGTPMAMIYDCSACEKRGQYAEETIVTLDDIRRISAYLGISWKRFFRDKITPDTSSSTGCLRLVRQGSCIFFKQDNHCTIEKVRPMHCRFRPCPLRTQTTGEMDALFLGSGTVEEQFQHQVAMAVTREYISECGSGYRKNIMLKHLKKMDNIIGESTELEKFCRHIAPYRYVDDTLTMLEL